MNVQIKYTWISRIVLLLFLLYKQVFSFFFPIGSSRMVEFAILGVALLAQLAEDRFFFRGKTSLWLLAFDLAALIISFLVAKDFSIASNYVLVFLEFTIMFYLVHRYSAMDGNIRFSSLAFVILAVVMAILNVAFDSGAERMTFSENLNVNAVGVVCMFGIANLLYLLIGAKKNPLVVTLVAILVLLLAFVVAKSVSRKAMIAAGVLIAFWLLFCYRQAFGKQDAFLRIVLFVVIIVGMYMAYQWFLKREAASVEYIRFRFDRMKDDDSGSTMIRSNLIREGFQVFLDHPILGVGMNNFRYYNSYQLYAHCSYIELLTCTGIVGAFLLGMPIVRALAHYVRALTKKRNLSGTARTETWFVLALFVTFLVLLWTQILFYEVYLMYMFALITAYIETLDGKDAAQEKRTEKSAAGMIAQKGMRP